MSIPSSRLNCFKHRVKENSLAVLKYADTYINLELARESNSGSVVSVKKLETKQPMTEYNSPSDTSQNDSELINYANQKQIDHS